MKIAPDVLLGQYRRSVAAWPFLPDVEASYRLPRCLLVAVASRETNCRNVVGDGGHGHGVFQYDDRSHAIPAGFDGDVRLQAETAAAMLRGLIDAFQGNVRAALDAYNAGAGAVRAALRVGRDPDSVTTGRDYGSDVLARMSYLQTATSPTPPPAPPVPPILEDDPMLIIWHANNAYLLAQGRLSYVAGPADLNALKTAGAKETSPVSDDEFGILCRAYGADGKPVV